MQTSEREFPPRLEYPAHFNVRKVAASGRIRWKSAMVTIGHAREGESIGIEERDGMHHVFFADVHWTAPGLVREVVANLLPSIVTPAGLVTSCRKARSFAGHAELC